MLSSAFMVRSLPGKRRLYKPMPQNSFAGLVLVIGTNVTSLVAWLVSTPPKVNTPLVISSVSVGAKKTVTTSEDIVP
jgi:ABC-type phosphate transport system permease subunit